MSDRWPGGIIRKTPVIPTGPNYNGAASGVWTMDQAAYWQRQGLWPTQGVGVGDPSFPYVTMLLATTSLNGGQNGTFLDTSTNNFTFTNVNTPTQGSFSPYGANWSGYFDGSGDYLSAPSNAAFDLGSSDFTVECWFNANSFATGFGLISRYNYSGVGLGWGLIINSATSIRFLRGNDILLDSTVSAMSVGTWYHVASVRSGSTLTVYLNGVQIGQATGISNFSDASTALQIGRTNTVTNDINGYISNVRVVKGTAVYTSAFTPPTQPLTAITNTSLLTCAYNRFRDGSTNNFTITVNADSKTTDFSPFSPTTSYSAATRGGSLLFNGSNEATYVDSSNAALTLGTGDFTIELWVYQLVLGGAQSWVSTYGGPSAGYRFSPTSAMQFSWGDTGIISTAVNTDVNQWSHVAVTRSGTTIRMFKNGVVIATGTDSTNLTGGSTQTTLGRIPTYNQWYYNGFMSDVRIVKGTAVYTADYTPPTAPLTAISGTSLLAAGANANIFDAAAMNNMTTVGNAQSSTAQAKFGGSSVAFDGTGDWITTPISSTLNLSSGNWTVEGWYYPTAYSASNNVIFYIGASSGDKLVMATIGTSGHLYYLLNGGAVVTSTAAASLNTWSHLALVKNGSTTTVYLNGTSIGSTTSVPTSSSKSLSLGADAGGAAYQGYIDDLRITNGVARYTANFTPPTTAFPTL